MRQEIYSGRSKLLGESHRETLIAANNYALGLLQSQRFKDAKIVLRKTIPLARRALGTEHEVTLSMREDLSRVILDGDSSANEKRKALEMLEDTLGVMRRVLGPEHPETRRVRNDLVMYREDARGDGTDHSPSRDTTLSPEHA